MLQAMNIKVGDKVKYLDRVGGGTVTRIKSRKEVWILEEDGFEVPANISDLVVVDPANFYFPQKDNNSSLYGTQTPSQPATSPSETPSSSAEEEQAYDFDDFEETPEGEKLSIYMAFVPTNIKDFQNSEVEVYLVNDSNYYLNFQWLLGKENVRIAKADVLEPMTTLRLLSLQRNELNDMQDQRFQATAFKKHDFTPKPAIDIVFGIRPVKFYKLHCFSGNEYFETPAMMLPLVEKDAFNLSMQLDVEATTQMMQLDVEAARQIIIAKDKVQQRTPNRKKINNKEPLEIDLHINNLLDSTAGMSPKDMFDYQMNKFHEVMRANLKKKGQRIVFIHGKGDGVLRAEILKQLRQKYPSCYVQDASFQKYGFGASMVTIK